MELSSLARTLAERMQAELSICMETEPCEVCINGAEAVIREAIDKTQPKWVSIEDEAPPKDGSEVILRVVRAGIEGSVVAHWMPGGHCIQDHPPIDEGWYWWNGLYFDLAPNPTHWMRLPEFSIRSLKQSNSGRAEQGIVSKK